MQYKNQIPYPRAFQNFWRAFFHVLKNYTLVRIRKYLIFIKGVVVYGTDRQRTTGVY